MRAAGELSEPAHTYALIHVPTSALHFGYTGNVRKVCNMWAKRLRNPDGNPPAPRTFMAFQWELAEWAMKIGKGYATLDGARAAHHQAVEAAKARGLMVLNRDLVYPHGIGTVRNPSHHLAVRMGKRAFDFPWHDAPQLHSMEWPELLRWLCGLNRKPYPADGEVRDLWYRWHEYRGVAAPSVVYDPDKQERRERLERRNAYYRNTQEVKAGLRPRTWAKLR